MDRLRRAIGALSAPAGQRSLQRALVVAMLLVGALDTWFYRQWNVNPDGVSYIDIARAFAARGPGELVNGYWSPLYPAVLGTGITLFSPGIETIYPMVRLIGFGVYILSVLAFAHLVTRATARRSVPHREPAWVAPTILASAWALFFLLVSQATGLHLVTPDIGVAAVVFLIAAELIALDEAGWTRARWMRFGALLAVGYWWKAILFPVGGLALLAAAWTGWRRREPLAGAATGVATFVALSLVVAIPVSRHAGRVTFGETGRVNQLWYVSNVPMVAGLCFPAEGRLARPELGAVQRDSIMLARPLTCATRASVPEASMPLWYDPAPYYAGVRSRFSMGETLVAVRNNVRYLREALADWVPLTAFALALAVVGVMAVRPRPVGGGPLVLLCLVPVGAYLVVYVELRHTVPFLVTLGLVALLALAAAPARWAKGVVAIVALAAGAESLRRVATQQRVEAAITVHRILGTERAEQLSAVAARELVARGLVAGDSVATVNGVWNVDWAQRIGVVVRAYTPEYTYPVNRAFDDLRDPCLLAVYRNLLRSRGLKAAILRDAQGFDPPGAFVPLAESGYRVMMAGPPEPAPAGCAPPPTRSSSGTGAR